MPASCHPLEWEARVKLAACYRIFDRLGWTELIYNHITLRLPAEASCGADGGAHFLINPFGLRYAEVKASNLVKVDWPARWSATAAGRSIRQASRCMPPSMPALPAPTA